MLRLILLVLAAVHVAMCQAASMLKGGDAQNEASAGAMWAKSLERAEAAALIDLHNAVEPAPEHDQDQLLQGPAGSGLPDTSSTNGLRVIKSKVRGGERKRDDDKNNKPPPGAKASPPRCRVFRGRLICV